MADLWPSSPFPFKPQTNILPWPATWQPPSWTVPLTEPNCWQSWTASPPIWKLRASMPPNTPGLSPWVPNRSSSDNCPLPPLWGTDWPYTDFSSKETTSWPSPLWPPPTPPLWSSIKRTSPTLTGLVWPTWTVLSVSSLRRDANWWRQHSPPLRHPPANSTPMQRSSSWFRPTWHRVPTCRQPAPPTSASSLRHRILLPPSGWRSPVSAPWTRSLPPIPNGRPMLRLRASAVPWMQNASGSDSFVQQQCPDPPTGAGSPPCI